MRRFDSQVFVDSELKTRQITGPSNYEAWLCCWRVFRAAMIMLEAASPATLDRYADGIRDLSRIHPQAWGIIFVADELNRYERWDTIMEDLTDGNDRFR